MTDFINKYHAFAAIVPYDKDRAERIAGVERTFHLLSNVYRTFDLLFSIVFCPNHMEDISQADESEDGGIRSSRRCVS